MQTGSDFGSTILNFSLQKSNSIYGASQHVQPQAVQLLTIIKSWVAAGCTLVDLPKIPLDHEALKEKEYPPIVWPEGADRFNFCQDWVKDSLALAFS